MPKGRPIKSEIRQNMIEILNYAEKGYGYDIYKVYIEAFPKITLRSIYYHLKKGTSLGEFKINKISMEKGNYSWGGEAEKIYYSLGSEAKPKGNSRLKKIIDSKKKT